MVAAASSGVSSPRRRITTNPRGPTSGIIASSRQAIHVSRPPILLELSERYVRVGYVVPPHHHHLASGGLGGAGRSSQHASSMLSSSSSTQMIVLPPFHTKNNSNNTNPALISAPEWYRYYSRILHDALSLVQEVSLTQKRKIVLVYHGHLLFPHQQDALEKLLLNTLQVPAISLVSALHVTGFSVSALQPHVLQIYADAREVHCIVMSCHQPLEYTYQATGWSEHTTTDRTSSATVTYPPTLQTEFDRKWKHDLLNVHSPHSLAHCIVSCLASCPRDIRKEVASHWLLSGDIGMCCPNHKLAKLLLKQVQTLLQPNATRDEESDPTSTSPTDATELASTVGNTTAIRSTYTHTPISKDLASLAPHLGVIHIPNVRPEALPWLGANVWASHWHSIHPDATAFQWKKATTTTTGPSTTT